MYKLHYYIPLHTKESIIEALQEYKIEILCIGTLIKKVAYKVYKNEKIIFVCLGNIYRSPLVEGYAKKYLLAHSISLEVYSSGTSNHHEGEAPCPHSIQVANVPDPYFFKGFDVFEKVYEMVGTHIIACIQEEFKSEVL